MKIRATVVVSGLVQGVGFRYHTSRAAARHQVTGWVRNLPDGSVQACFEGERGEVLAMVEWCRQGPDSARVEDVVEKLDDYTGEFAGFQVRNSHD